MLVAIAISTLLGATPVTWSAPAGCPDAAQAQQLVDLELAGLPEDERAEVEVEGRVREAPPGFVLQARLKTRDGTIDRTVALDECDGAAEALALVVAIAIDPTRAQQEVPTPPEPEVDAPDDASELVPAPPEDPPSDPVEPRDAMPPSEPDESTSDSTTPRSPTAADAPTRDRPRLRGALTITGGAALGVLPSVGAQLGGGAALLWPHARLGLRAEHWLRRRERLDDPADLGGDFSITEARLEAGPVPSWGRVELPLLGFVGAGVVHARGEAPGSRDRRVPWVSVGLTPGVLWLPRRWLGLGAQLDLVVPLLRHTFVLGESTVVTNTGPVAGAVRAIIELRFP